MFSHSKQSARKSLGEKRKRDAAGSVKRPRAKPSSEPDNKKYSPFLLNDTQDVIWEENPEIQALSCTQTSVTDVPAVICNKENVESPVPKKHKKRKWKGRLTRRALRPMHNVANNQEHGGSDAVDQGPNDDNRPEEIIQLLESIANKLTKPASTPSTQTEPDGNQPPPERSSALPPPTSSVELASIQQPDIASQVNRNSHPAAPGEPVRAVVGSQLESAVVTSSRFAAEVADNQNFLSPTTQPTYAVEDVSLEELAELDEIEKFAYTQAAAHSQRGEQLSANSESQRSACSTRTVQAVQRSEPQCGSAVRPQASCASINRSQSNTQIQRSQSEPGRKRAPAHLHGPLQCYRFVALEIGEGQGVRSKQVLCTLVDSNVSSGDGAQNGSAAWTVWLQDEWYCTPLSTGDTFHVIGLGKDAESGLFTQITLRQPSGKLELSVDNSRGMLVVHPDILVSPTKVADACNCDRRGALSERMKTFGNLSRPAVLGNVKHTFAEQVIRSFNENMLRTPHNRPAPPNQQAIKTFIQQARTAHIVELYAVDADDAQVDVELRSLVGPLWRWLHSTISQQHFVKRSQTVPVHNRTQRPTNDLQLDHIVGTEENIWSPVFGLKGQIDVTAAITSNGKSVGGALQAGLSPLELKTGKRRDYTLIPHKAQVMLYLLLLQTRVQHTQYARIGREGFLVYLNSEGVVCDHVLPVWDEIRSLMMARNRCALSTRGVSSGPLRYDSAIGLPPVIRQPNDCSRCYQAAECMLYHAAYENGSPRSSGVPDLFEQNLQSLKPEHLSYFRHWDRLIELESTTGAFSRPQLWTMDGSHREKATGKCIGGLVCDGTGQDLVTGDSLLTLKRHPHSLTSDQLSLKELPFAAGDRVIVSLDGHRVTSRDDAELVDLEDCRVSAAGQPLGYGVHLFVANVSCVDDTSIQLRVVDLPEYIPHWVAGQAPQSPRMRIDKDELSTGVATMRSNLAQLLIEPYKPPRNSAAPNRSGDLQLSEPEDVRLAGVTKLRSLVVDLIAPQFVTIDCSIEKWFERPPADVSYHLGPNGEQHRLGYPTLYPECAPEQLIQELEALNPDQRSAIHKVLSAQDYTLLLGMPGTGKTYTIACLVRTLVARGATVLLSSYTHSAVDNMLQKLADAGITPGMALRLGSKHQTPEQLHPYLLDSRDVDSVSRLSEVVASSRIVATTCLGARHPVFTKKRFDVCILDEAGQAPQPAALGPLLSADKFVLVGDHYQLPPLVANPEAQLHGMDISLFRRLCEAHPDAVQYLSFQYRMNAEIMHLSNTLVYGQRLRCANSTVEKGRLQLSRFHLLEQRCGASPTPSPTNDPQDWLLRVLHPSNSVVFIDTDTLTLSQRVKISGTQELTPEGQHTIESKLTELCVRSLLACGAQPSDIGVITPFRSQQRALRRTIAEVYGVEVSTMDKFQGRDVRALVVSFGSTARGTVGDLLRDWRRINVAITRARFKLIMLGSKSMAASSPVMAELLEIVYGKRWDMDMPRQLARYEAIVTQVLNLTRSLEV